eukprot:CAMPEP_0197238538 /NCGR_PEP_ID=MMETSP1429-20130617/5026_1 /TAXON_ID=49237 /ORGANISM="Chaetoceros  sp., Strain UNC1202" /LENGTH=225 /DNA_ID=CAMNT_0042697721 /DNA_START=44 /DNA_END=721 /DNA_ORIENTATION=-
MKLSFSLVLLSARSAFAFVPSAAPSTAFLAKQQSALLASRNSQKIASRSKWAKLKGVSDYESKGVTDCEDSTEDADADFIVAIGTSEVPASQADVAPLLTDLVKIQDYHPSLGTATIVSEQTSGIGAKRRLDYASGETSFFETVVEENGAEMIRFELTEHPFPCTKMFAQIETGVIDENNTGFKVNIEYQIAPGTPEPVVERFGKGIQGLTIGMAAGAKQLFVKD